MKSVKTFGAAEISQEIDQNTGLLLVHFGSPLASSCEFVNKELELLAPRFANTIHFGEVEIPLQDLELIQRYGIEEIPTLILFHGKEPVERLERIFLPEDLCGFLEAAASFYAGKR